MEDLNYRYYILMILLPMLAICSIRSLRYSIDIMPKKCLQYVHVSQCENFIILLTLRFYGKSIFGILELLKSVITQLEGRVSEFWFLWILALFEGRNWLNNQNSESPKFQKMAFLELSRSQTLISRKIRMTEKGWNFHTVQMYVSTFFCRYLSPCSVIANVFQFVGLGIVFYYIFRDPLPHSSSVPWIAKSERLPLFFGTAIFAIEGISVVLPIENQMRKPKEMLGWNGVLNTSMALVTALYVAMGFYGYLKYGETIESSITLNLPTADMYVVN